jgi:putative N6-adenine-specific DNA methylase
MTLAIKYIGVEAPLNEVLAAGMILMTGWRGECDLIDPMCGSGTIPIEAALIARNIAPGVFRKEFGFEKWRDFDQDLFDSIYNDDSNEREFNHKIYGYDNNPKANEIAVHNVKAAGVSKDVILKIQPFQQFEQPKEKSIIVTNPPYGERISSDDLLGLYQMIGERLKHAFSGNDAWILSYRDECFDQIGLKPSVKVPLFNGSLECQFRKYQIFDGKYKTFRSENSDKEFKPKREGNETRPRKRAEKVEYKGDKKTSFRTERKENDKKNFSRENRPSRPSTDDGRPKQAPAPRYMHRRRANEENTENE